MAIFNLSQFLSLRNIPAWNLVRGIENQYDFSTENPELTGIALPTDAPSAFSIAAGVITVTPRHLPESAVEVDSMDIVTDQGNFPLILNFRDWFPSDAPTSLSTFHSVFRSVDGSARELWRGTYWHPSTSGGNIDTTEDIIVMSDEDGYLNFPALVNQLVAINSDGLLYITRLTDQRATFHLVAAGDHEPIAVAIVGGSASTYTVRRNGHLFMRGSWAASEINSNWFRVNRLQSEFLEVNAPLGNYWGIVSVMQKFNADNNRLFQFGDNNAYPGIRDVGDRGYFFNTDGIRPDNLDPGDDTWYDPHCVIMDEYRTFLGNNVRGIRSLRLEDSSAHHSSTRTVFGNIQTGTGRRLFSQDYHWAEGMIFDIPGSNDENVRQTNLNNWIATRTNVANNLASLIGNVNLNYDLVHV